MYVCKPIQLCTYIHTYLQYVKQYMYTHTHTRARARTHTHTHVRGEKKRNGEREKQIQCRGLGSAPAAGPSLALPEYLRGPALDAAAGDRSRRLQCPRPRGSSCMLILTLRGQALQQVCAGALRPRRRGACRCRDHAACAWPRHRRLVCVSPHPRLPPYSRPPPLSCPSSAQPQHRHFRSKQNFNCNIGPYRALVTVSYLRG